MKIFLYILLLTSLTLAQFTGSPSRGDATYNITNDLDPINGLEEVEAGRVGQKVVKDTVVLKTYKPDSAGVIVQLKQLSSANTNGGGLLVYKSSGSALKGVRWAVTGGGIWERMELSYSPDVNIEWLGAIPDDANDDYATINGAKDVAITLKGDVLVPVGVYRLSSKITILPQGSSDLTVVKRPVFRGKGKLRSVLYFYNGTDGIHFNGGASVGGWIGNIGVEDLEIRGSDGAGTSGLIFDSTGTVIAARNWIRDFGYGLRLIQPNNCGIYDNRIAYNTFGVYATNSPNEITLINNYITNNDSIQFFQNSGNGTVILGGAIAHGDFGVWAENGAQIHLKSVPMEGIIEHGIHAITSAFVRVDGVQVTSIITDGISNRVVYVNNATVECRGVGHSGANIDTVSFAAVGTNAVLMRDYASSGRATWTPTSTAYELGKGYFRNFSNSSFLTAWVTDPQRWGEFGRWTYRPGSNGDHLWVNTRMKDSTLFQMPIGNEIRVSSDASNQPVVDRTNPRWVGGIETWQRAVGTDSTVITVVADTNGFSNFGPIWGMPNFLNVTRTDSIYNVNVIIADDDGSVGNGIITFVIQHTKNMCGTCPPDGVNYRFHWGALIRPNNWEE